MVFSKPERILRSEMRRDGVRSPRAGTEILCEVRVSNRFKHSRNSTLLIGV